MFAIISRMTALTRVAIYRHLIATGRAPTAAETAEELGRDLAEVEGDYTELAESRVITFAPSTRSIWMAHPFSATPTPYRVESEGISYWANCAWDALGIAAMLGRDTRCICRCPDCADTLDLSVTNGDVGGDALIHFVVPARRFWENVAYT
jgi:hypothetical protein